MHPVVSFSGAGAGADVSVDADTDVGVSVSDADDENDGTGSSGVFPPESETPPRDDSLCRSPRSTGVLMLKFREAV